MRHILLILIHILIQFNSFRFCNIERQHKLLVRLS